MRLDQYVANQQNCSRTYAQTLIKAGKVTVNNKIVVKSSYNIEEETIIIQDENKYVSRGAYKLEDALNSFHIDVENLIAIDVGASTGGFCDVLLQHKIQKVYAIDVGSNQLHAKIKNNSKVISFEHLNARTLNATTFPEKFTFATMDVSFISIDLIIPALKKVMAEQFEMVLLIKPQFEVGVKHLNKHGIVKDEKIIFNMLEKKINFFYDQQLSVKHLKKCAITGKDGNQEYLVHLTNQPLQKQSLQTYLKRR